jgi:aspartate-semialdehyde dehydrogenase
LAPIIVRSEPDRPQPLLDADAGQPDRAKGMAITIGRIRVNEDSLRFYLLVHNTIRGGAGGSVLNAELAYKEGLI